MKIFLILTFICLIQVCNGEEFSVTVTLSHLKDYLKQLEPESNYTLCFNKTLRVPFFYAVKNFSVETENLSEEVRGNGTNYLAKISTEIKTYPGKMGALIDEGKLNDAEEYMDMTQDTIRSFMVGFTEQLNDPSDNIILEKKFDSIYENFENKINVLVTNFKNCIDEKSS